MLQLLHLGTHLYWVYMRIALGTLTRTMMKDPNTMEPM